MRHILTKWSSQRPADNVSNMILPIFIPASVGLKIFLKIFENIDVF